jgi:hypothetical protein
MTDTETRTGSDRTGADAKRLRQLIMGFRLTQPIHAAAKLGLADHLAGQPQTAL